MSRKILIAILLLGLMLTACTAFSDVGEEVTAETDEIQGVIVEGIPTLTVNHFAGNIDIRTGEDGQITANLTKMSRLTDQADAEAQLEEIVMSFSQRGTDVTLNIEGPDAAANIVNMPSADLELLVPAGTTLSLNLGAGDIIARQPGGDLTVNTGAGNATAVLPADASFRLEITGGAVDVTSDFEEVPGGGVAVDIDTTVGSSPTQTLIFNIGAGKVHLQESE